MIKMINNHSLTWCSAATSWSRACARKRSAWEEEWIVIKSCPSSTSAASTSFSLITTPRLHLGVSLLFTSHKVCICSIVTIFSIIIPIIVQWPWSPSKDQNVMLWPHLVVSLLFKPHKLCIWAGDSKREPIAVWVNATHPEIMLRVMVIITSIFITKYLPSGATGCGVKLSYSHYPLGCPKKLFFICNFLGPELPNV